MVVNRALNMSSTVRNIIAAGQASGRASAELYDGVRSNSVNYTDIHIANMRARAGNKIAAMKAAEKVKLANIVKGQQVQDAKIDVKADKAEAASKKKQRMAGVLAAAGGKIGAGIYLNSPEKRSNKYSEAHAAYIQKLQDKLNNYESPGETAVEKEVRRQLEELNNLPDIPEIERPSSSGSSSSSSSSNTSGGLVSSGQAVKAGVGTGSGGKLLSQKEIEQHAIQAGFSPQNAKVMAAIGMGESGGDAGIDTVQSGLDPGKSNEYSIGVVQINAQAHGDKLARRGWTEEDLRDPAKNMIIAKEVYDEAGGFTPWSVYKKGIHEQYLN